MVIQNWPCGKRLPGQEPREGPSFHHPGISSYERQNLSAGAGAARERLVSYPVRAPFFSGQDAL